MISPRSLHFARETPSGAQSVLGDFDEDRIAMPQEFL